MAKHISLMNYLDDLENDYNQQRMNLNLNSRNLESSVISSFESFKDDLKNIEVEGIFDIYLETNNISRQLMKEYTDLVDKLKDVPYYLDKNSLLRKFANKTSKWYHKGWSGLSVDSEDNKFYHGAFAFGTFVAGAILGGITGSWIIGLGSGPALWYSLFKKKTELKEEVIKFERDPKLVIEEAYRLNYLAQKMEREVSDIATLDVNQIDNFVEKYGIEEIRRKMIIAKDEVLKVKNYTGRILLEANIEAPKLGEYVTTGIRMREIYEEATNGDVEGKLKELRKVTEAKLKQGDGQ